MKFLWMANLGLAAICCPPPVDAAVDAEELSDTGQINPDALPVLAAANFRFDGQPEGLGDAINGVEFEDVVWGEETTLSNDTTVEGSIAGSIRTANILDSLEGEDAEALAEIANSINFYNVNTDGTLTFGGLPENHAVVVQLITSDAASSFNNWAGRFTITTTDTTNDEVTEIGDFEAGTEPDFFDAQLATFEATTDASGNLQIGIDQTEGGQHAGIGGIAVYSGVPEIVGIELSSADFLTTIGPSAKVSTLSTVDQKVGATHSYVLVVGDGDADNAKFVIVGNQLQTNATHDFSESVDGTVFQARIRSTDNDDADRQFEIGLLLKIHADSDGDRLWDSWETRHTEPDDLAALAGDGVADADGDGLTDLREFELSQGQFPNINPTNSDSDGDSLGDGDEIAGAGSRPPTNPTLSDSDGDGLGDGAETNTGVFVSAENTGSNPIVADSDNDGLGDGAEVEGSDGKGFKSNPNLPDSDGDGIGDANEIAAGTDPSNPGDFPSFRASQLTETGQLNPAGATVLAAVNFIFDGQPEGFGGTVNGVEFEDVFWDEETTLSTDVEVLGSAAGSIRVANTGSTISGDGEEILENVTNSINFYNVGTDGTLTFSNLSPGQPVVVQLITSDAASRFNNWAGIFEISVRDTSNDEVILLGDFQAGTEPDNFDAQLATFSTIADSTGVLEIVIDQTVAGQHAGVAGVVVLEGGAGAPFEFTAIEYDATNRNVSLTWSSSPGRSYIVDKSTDFETWLEINDNVQSQGDLTTFVDDEIAAEDTIRYYRVHED